MVGGWGEEGGGVERVDLADSFRFNDGDASSFIGGVFCCCFFFLLFNQRIDAEERHRRRRRRCLSCSGRCDQ